MTLVNVASPARPPSQGLEPQGVCVAPAQSQVSVAAVQSVAQIQKELLQLPSQSLLSSQQPLPWPPGEWASDH